MTGSGTTTVSSATRRSSILENLGIFPPPVVASRVNADSSAEQPAPAPPGTSPMANTAGLVRTASVATSVGEPGLRIPVETTNEIRDSQSRLSLGMSRHGHDPVSTWSRVHSWPISHLHRLCLFLVGGGGGADEVPGCI